MARHRAASSASAASSAGAREQELSSMYDYLAKVILLGPSACGKPARPWRANRSCLLHRFVKDEWRVLTSQTIGVEFASKIVKVGTGTRRRRVKLQLWDTAGTERFRSVARSYYRGAAGAVLVYDVANASSFRALPTFLGDARALASPHLSLVLAGNKSDLAEDGAAAAAESSPSSAAPASPSAMGAAPGLGTRSTATEAPDGRAVVAADAAAWAASHDIATAVEVSALSGDGVERLFESLASTILTRIELGEIDPDDPASGIHYGDTGWSSRLAGEGNGSVRSDDGKAPRRRRGLGGATGGGGSWRGMRDWEEVFNLNYGRGRRRGCC